MAILLQPRNPKGGCWNTAQSVADIINAPEGLQCATIYQTKDHYLVVERHHQDFDAIEQFSNEPQETERELRWWNMKWNKAMFQELSIPAILDNAFGL